IAAYKDELKGVSSLASGRQREQLDKYINELKVGRTNIEAEIKDKENQLHGSIDLTTGKPKNEGISQEELSSIRSRTSLNRTSETNLKLRQIVIGRELADIAAAGNSRPQRQAVTTQLGIAIDHPSIFIGDVKDPDSLLASLKFKRADLSTRFGSGHPEMAALS